MSKFNPDYSHRTDYTTEYPFDSVIFPTDAPLLAQDLNEVQDILNNKINSLNYALYTDGYIHTIDSSLYSDTSDLRITGYVIISGRLYRVSYQDNLSSYLSTSDELFVYIDVIDKNYDETSAIPLSVRDGQTVTLRNYLGNNSFDEEVSRREGYSVSVRITAQEATSSNRSLLLMKFKGGELIYVAPVPAPKKTSAKDALLDMRVGKTFRCYDANIKSFEHHFEDNGTFYYVADNGATTNNIELYRSDDLVNWEKCSLHENAATRRFEASFSDAVNGHIFLFTTDGYMYVSTDNGNTWSESPMSNVVEDDHFKVVIYQCKVIPVGTTGANVVFVEWHKYQMTNTRILLLYFDSSANKWVYDNLDSKGIHYLIESNEIPKIGNYVITPAGDVCLAISAVKFSNTEDCYSFVIAFTCESGRLIYNKAIVASQDSTDVNLSFGSNLNYGYGNCRELKVNVAGHYPNCPNPDRCISYFSFTNNDNETGRIMIWCLENEGSSFEIQSVFGGRKPVRPLAVYDGAYEVTGTGEKIEYKNQLTFDGGVYSYTSENNHKTVIWEKNNQSFAKSRTVLMKDGYLKHGLYPTRSEFYKGIIFLYEDGSGYRVTDEKDIVQIGYIPSLKVVVAPGENSVFLTDKNGKVYAMWQNNDKALPTYHISSLSAEFVWSEPKEIVVDKYEELKPFYADHAIYFENNGDIYISGEIK